MASSLSGTIIAEKYRLGELLRAGEHGDLYDARHVLTDKRASVRVLRPSLATDSANVERFFDAAKLASKISDPHVLNISDFGTDPEGFVYAVFEPLDGKTLKDVIGEDGALPVYSAVEVARQIAYALIAAHSAGQIHGDLTTENVVLTGNAGINVKVVDFGAANPLISESEAAADFAYLAPEQCAGSDKADERGDIYSLGCILYETLAGTPPFTGEKPSEVMLKHIEELPPPLSAYRTDLPDTIEPVIVKALSKDPEMRQQTAAEFLEESNAASEGLSPTAVAAAAPGNNIWKTAFIVMVAMSALAAFLIYGTYVRRTDPTTALQPDANGQPVQPIGPATGTEEMSLAAMPAYDANTLSNANAMPPGTLPGGDGYNPWAAGAPPPGAPSIGPGGSVVNVGPAAGNPIMPSGVLYDTVSGQCVDAGTYQPVPCPGAVKPKPSPSPAATGTPPAAKPSPSPAATQKPPPANAKTPQPEKPPGESPLDDEN